MRKEIIKILTEHGYLIEPKSIEYILAQKDPISYITRVLGQISERHSIITLEDLKRLESKNELELSSGGRSREFEISEQIKIPTEQKPVEEMAYSRDWQPIVQILSDIPESTICTCKLDDFYKYFNWRYESIKNMLRTRRELFGFMPISKLKPTNGTQLKAIGLVNDVKMTKHGHKLIELQDPSGTITALVPSNSQLITDPLTQDEVIGFMGRFSQRSNLLIIDTIIRPEFEITREVHRTKEDIAIAFISDLHIGSKTFLYDAWQKFTDWLRNDENIGCKIKYIVIAGDAVDGIGVYPQQEKDLRLKDINRQYEELSKNLADIPQELKIILLPGNHDAVREAEPQPPLPENIRQKFSDNVTFVTNPCYLSIHGIEILAYHGRSMDDLVTSIPNASYSQPIQMMKEMLKRRHLAVVYGGRTPIAPEHKDYLVIERVPDIFITGHTHYCAVERYKNIILINSSCWQSRTGYQAMQGFTPIPARAVVVNTHTLEPKILDFS